MFFYAIFLIKSESYCAKSGGYVPTRFLERGVRVPTIPPGGDATAWCNCLFSLCQVASILQGFQDQETPLQSFPHKDIHHQIYNSSLTLARFLYFATYPGGGGVRPPPPGVWKLSVVELSGKKTADCSQQVLAIDSAFF